MAMPKLLEGRLAVPVMAAPMFIVSQVELVLAQCRAGVVGAFPSLNARPPALLDAWLGRLGAELGPADAPYAVNLIVHRSNPRLEADLERVVEHRVPIVITSLGAREDVIGRVHGYGGIVFHDVTDDAFARKAVDKGADGLVAVAAGAGGHAGTLSPFALVGEIRRWFDGPLALSGAIATGGAVLAAQAMGADLAYVGTPFIATHEASAADAYKAMVVASHARDIVYSDHFTGVHGNYLGPSIAAAGLDPTALPASDPSAMDFAAMTSGAKAWRDIWGCGQGVGAVEAVVGAGELVARLAAEHAAARAALRAGG